MLRSSTEDSPSRSGLNLAQNAGKRVTAAPAEVVLAGGPAAWEAGSPAAPHLSSSFGLFFSGSLGSFCFVFFLLPLTFIRGRETDNRKKRQQMYPQKKSPIYTTEHRNNVVTLTKILGSWLFTVCMNVYLYCNSD